VTEDNSIRPYLLQYKISHSVKLKPYPLESVKTRPEWVKIPSGFMKIGLSYERVNWNFPVLKRHLAIYNICHTPVCEGQYHSTSAPNFPVDKVESRRWRAMSNNPYFTVSSYP
jgi:hypothetical protein